MIREESRGNSKGERITNKTGMPIFMLTFNKGESTEKTVFNIRSVMGIVVKMNH